MNKLPAALAGLAQYPQFMNYILVPQDDGSTNKYPVSPHTGKVCDAHDPANHATLEVALAAGENLAFVFTAHDPYAFLDIDHCARGNKWSPEATALCALFAGAAIEISQSGEGLHVFFRQPPGTWPHGCDNKLIGSQFFTEKRFVALTGTSIAGDVDHMPTEETYRNFIKDYFTPDLITEPQAYDAEWTVEPDPEWNGPENDEDLLKKMLKSKSARGILGKTATIRQLWEADETALGKAFPDEGGRPFDWSSADAALCHHLAFWTGKNCERMDTMFRTSALMRDKWDSRGDYYSRRTILRAKAGCDKVYRQRQAIVGPDGAPRAGFQYYTLQNQQKLFQGCCYVQDRHKIFVPDTGVLLRPDQFRATFGGYVFALDTIGDKTTRNAFEVFTESQATRFPRVHSTCFRPELAPGAIISEDGSSLVNTYVPIETQSTPGDPTPFLDLLRRLLPVERDAEILLAYLAACVQHIGVKFQWAPLIQGIQGNGKSFIGSCLVHAIGERYTHILDSKDISNKFNGWMRDKVFILIEEVYTKAKIDTIEALKWMITNSRVPMQAKGQDQVTGDNRANFFMCSNHRDAIKKTQSDRRFCVFYTAQQYFPDLADSGMDGKYFPHLYNWARDGGYGIITNFLQNYAIPAKLNPAGDCHRAPVTSSTDAAIVCSMSSVEQEVIEAVESGRTGFINGWISSMALDKLLTEKKEFLANNKRKDMLLEIGYVPHPALRLGRVNNPIAIEGGKPSLYVKIGHPAGNITDQAMVSRVYQENQGYVIGGSGGIAAAENF